MRPYIWLYLVITMLSLALSNISCRSNGSVSSPKVIRAVAFYSPIAGDPEDVKKKLRDLFKKFANISTGFGEKSRLDVYRVPEKINRRLQNGVNFQLSQYPDEDMKNLQNVKSKIDTLKFDPIDQEYFEIFKILRSPEFKDIDYLFIFGSMIQKGTEYDFIKCKDSIPSGFSGTNKFVFNLDHAEGKLYTLEKQFQIPSNGKQVKIKIYNTVFDISPEGDCSDLSNYTNRIISFWNHFFPDSTNVEWFMNTENSNYFD